MESRTIKTKYSISLPNLCPKIFQISIGCVGLAGNLIAMPILLSKRMKTVFNRLLVFLAIFDNVFICCSILEAIRKHYGTFYELGHVYAYAFFFYQVCSQKLIILFGINIIKILIFLKRTMLSQLQPQGPV